MWRKNLGGEDIKSLDGERAIGLGTQTLLSDLDIR